MNLYSSNSVRGMSTSSLRPERPVVEGSAQLEMHEGMEALYANVRSTRYRRCFALSNDLDSDKVDANLKDGVLTHPEAGGDAAARSKCARPEPGEAPIHPSTLTFEACRCPKDDRRKSRPRGTRCTEAAIALGWQ
jgi:Hsp20/alpha crystallin family